MNAVQLFHDYDNKLPLYQDFTDYLKRYFKKLLSSKNISYFQIEYRVKSLESYLDKAYRLYHEDPNFNGCINDIVGVRIITYYEEDIQTISRIIESEFNVKLKNTEYESQNRSPDRFGYASTHYKATLSKKQMATHGWRRFKDIVFEIQLRTVAQHAWATIDHKIRYKSAKKLPNDIQRQIFQLSALFELADHQFSSIRKEIESEELQELNRMQNGEMDAKVNNMTLGYYLDSHKKLIQKLVRKAKSSGFQKISIKNDANSVRYLLILFEKLGIDTIEELNDLFEEARNKADIIFKNIYDTITDKTIINLQQPFPLISLLVITLRFKSIGINGLDEHKLILDQLDALYK